MSDTAVLPEALDQEARMGTPTGGEKKQKELVSFDYRSADDTPTWGRELIEAQLAMTMARAMKPSWPACAASSASIAS